jgi:hypothetical protein
MSDASTKPARKRYLRIIAWTYGTLWAVTALFGLPDVDRKFDLEFAVGTQGFAVERKRPDIIPVIRIPFSGQLRDPRAMPSYVPAKPWRSRSSGIAIAPFLVIDEVACQWGSLAGLSAHRIVFWFFRYTEWARIKTYWVS